MKKGFTLVELLAVIVILGVIGLIATPMVLDYVKESKEDSVKISLDNIVRAADMYFVSNNIKNDTVIDLTSGLIELKNNNISKGIVVGNRKYIKTYIYQNGYCGIKDGKNITVKKTTIDDCDFSINDNIKLITNNKVPKTKKILGYRIYGNTLNNNSLGSNNNQIVLKLTGKNLFDISKINVTSQVASIIENEIQINNTGYQFSIIKLPLSLELNKQYILSLKTKDFISDYTGNIRQTIVTYLNGTIQEAFDTNSVLANSNMEHFVTFPLTKEIDTFELRLNRCVGLRFVSTAIIYVIQLEEGTEATPYEPYLEPKEYTINLSAPLRKYGNKVDYIDSSINQIVRNVGVRADGTLYELEKPKYEYIKLPSITNLDGTTIVSSSDGNISSSKIEIIVSK